MAKLGKFNQFVIALLGFCFLDVYSSLPGYLSTILSIQFIREANSAPGFEPAADDRRDGAASRRDGELSSSLYDVVLKFHALPAPGGSRSAIAKIDNGILYLSNVGKLFFKSTRVGQSPFVAVGEDVSFNPDEPAFGRFNPLHITILDIAARKNDGGGYDVFASHVAADNEKNCLFVRVVKNEISGFDSEVPVLKGKWREFYDTVPCMPVEELDPDLLSLSGGRIAFHRDSMFVSVGTFNWEIAGDASATAQDRTKDYGKILKFAGDKNTAELFSLGHRNPQGLFITDDGVIYETEHGPQGGDEINVIEQGQNYGWPYVTYGVQGGKHSWDWSTEQQRHSNYRKPLYAFVPSIGSSQIIRLRGKEFADWAGDLMVASLRARTLYHVRVEGDRVVFVEPLFIGERIRDMAELDDGRIAMVTDSSELIILSARRGAPHQPVISHAADSQAQLQVLAAAEPRMRGNAEDGGEQFRKLCAFCHTLAVGSGNHPGPSLRCVFGRRVASLDDHIYSAALRAKAAERWDPTNLMSFLSNTQAWAPGTAMGTSSFSNKEDMEDLIDYLYTETVLNCKEKLHALGPDRRDDIAKAAGGSDCGAGEPELSLKACTAIIEYGEATGQTLADAYANRGNALQRRGDLDSAIADYDKAITLDPKSVAARIARGGAHFLRGEFDFAIVDYTEAILLDPQNIEAYNGRGTAYKDNGQLDRAIADFDKSINLDPKSGYTFNSRGDAYARKGYFDRAIEDYDKSIGLNAGHAKAYYNRGNAFKDKGDFDRAIASYDMAIGLDPKDAENFNKRGIAYRDRGDLDRAIADFDLATSLDASSAETFYHRGLALTQRGDLDRAIADFDQAISLDPERFYVYYDRGLAYKGRGDLGRAIADFDIAISRNPAMAYAFYNRGLAYRGMGDLDSAIADLNKAIGLDPKQADAYYNRGLAFKGRGELDDAIADLDKTIGLDPNSAKAYYIRGLVHKQAGDVDRATRDCKEALRLEPRLAEQIVKAGLGCASGK